MKAWRVSDKYGNCGTEIVFAETRGKAISLCMHDEVFWFEPEHLVDDIGEALEEVNE